jgi:hypothetical protein
MLTKQRPCSGLSNVEPFRHHQDKAQQALPPIARHLGDKCLSNAPPLRLRGALLLLRINPLSSGRSVRRSSGVSSSPNPLPPRELHGISEWKRKAGDRGELTLTVLIVGCLGDITSGDAKSADTKLKTFEGTARTFPGGVPSGPNWASVNALRISLARC